MSLVPFDDRDGWIWLDGQFVPWREAKVHVLSHALHYASCVFEGERVYDGQVFKLTEHNRRLVDSARTMGFEIPWDVAAIDEACRRVVAANGIGDGYVRPVAWRGAEMMGVSAQRCQIHLAIAAWTWPAYFTPEARLKGIRMTRGRYGRPAPDTAPVKSKAAGLYMICTLSKHEAEAKGYCHGHYLRLQRTGRVDESPLRVRGRLCSLPDCDRPHKAKGYCPTHYKRFLEHGDPLADMPIRESDGNGHISHGYRQIPVPRQLRHLVGGKTKVAEHRLLMGRHGVVQRRCAPGPRDGGHVYVQGCFARHGRWAVTKHGFRPGAGCP